MTYMYLLRKQKISARIFFVLKNSDIKKKKKWEIPKSKEAETDTGQVSPEAV